MTIGKTFVAAGVAGVTGLAVVAARALTAAAEQGTVAAVTDRVTAITEALDGLVSDGTITQERAGVVASTLTESGALREPHGTGRVGLDLDVAADALGMTAEELRTLAEDGATLASVAEAAGVSTDPLVKALVDAATERVQAAAAEGRLDPEKAEEIVAGLPERVAALVEEELRRGMGHRGPGPDERGDASSGNLTPEDASAIA
ncbi:hypothetical protein PU560_03320 [Georgenia sp. 10Sc9-8]|uniref:DUF937 domain-containing protein n=1 Tax=Georgenia halotolerans TaxID=3028317 RepID=A0ABT5TUY3_9MICO|nr:hypothetical protein [Georgenia halotolerans]